MLSSRVIGVVLLFLLLPSTGGAQSTDSTSSISDACAGPAFRAFDFWIGQWVVRDSTGSRVGTSHISSVAEGCGVLEQWTGASGSRGTSLNYYDPDEEAWHQEWVGNNGLILHLSGKRTGDAMVLEGRRVGAERSMRDRIRWRPLEGGKVRQEWTVSTDGGATWKRVFLGVYEPRSGDISQSGDR